MAVVSTSRGVAFPPHVCTAQSLCTTLGIKLLWQPIYTKHLTQSVSLFEEFLLPRTEKGVLNMGLCTQQAQPPIPTTCLCLFFFPFFSSNPQDFVPSADFITMMWCSRRLLRKICLITEGQQASGPPAWEAGSATPDFLRGTAWPQTSPRLWAQMGGEAQPRCRYFSQA